MVYHGNICVLSRGKPIYIFSLSNYFVWIYRQSVDYQAVRVTHLAQEYRCAKSFLACPISCSPTSNLVLSGSLEAAQERKADALIARARLSKHHRLLDIGFGWGGISIRRALACCCCRARQVRTVFSAIGFESQK